jgi:PIN domain nuclease of toxin-antitoxin system
VKVLADTHALVWFALADPRLSAIARAVLADPSNEILVSPASYWEIAVKVHLGKWQLAQPYPDLIDSLWTVYGFHILPILPDHTARLIGLANHHGDPFDRLLAVQALAEGVSLVSADPVFDLYGVPRIWS